MDNFDNIENIDQACEKLMDNTFKSIIELSVCLGFSLRDIDLISKGF